MKDGGWLDKFDVPEAQNGIEGTMGGLTDIGFNYNGAWGGPSMAMGGSMPGAVGFTYARTGGIPSNGPYAKKTKASAQNGKEMKFYQEGLDWKPRNISRDGSEIPQAQMGTMVTPLNFSKPIGTLEGVSEVMSAPARTATYLLTGKYQDPSQALGIKNPVGAFVTDAILDPTNLLGIGVAGKVAKAATKTAGKVVKAADKVATAIGKPVVEAGQYIDKKFIYPRVFKKEMEELKKVHELAPKRYNSPEAAPRINQVLGIDPKNIQQPALTFEPHIGSHYSSLFNNINIDLRQAKNLRKKQLLSPKSIYEHEYGHFLQRESNRHSEDFAKEVSDYEKEVAKYNSPENQKILKDPSLWLNNKDAVLFSPGIKPIPASRPTKIDLASNKVFDRQKGLGVLPDKGVMNLENALDNSSYFTHRNVEQMPFLREMRQSMLDKKYIKDYYEPISQETISRFIQENPKNRIASFTSSSNAKRMEGLEKLFRNLPAIVPAIGVGAAATVEQKKKGGKIKKDDNGYWNPENWGEPVEIGSNEITMQGVYEPLLGVSDTGDVQYMEPGQDYKFKGNKVTEYPIAQEGIKTSANPYFKSAKERDAYRQRLKEVSEQALSVGSDEDLLIGTSYHNIDEGNNCINGICGLNRRAGITYNKPTDVDRFLSGEKFAQAVAKGDEDYYQVDGNFQIGDHMMYRKKKGTASHNKIIYDSFVNNQGEKVYKVIDNAGGKQMKTDNYTESELKKMQLEGGGGYDKVNIYRPGYSIDKTLIEKERLERTSPEARKALADRAERIAWETSNNPGYKYSIRKDSEYYNDQPEGMQKFIEFANDDKKINKLVEKLGVDKGVIHDELLNTFGELGQENKWEDRTFGGTGGIENTIEKIFKPKSWSIGPGQIKFNTIDPELKQKFNIKKPKDLYDFDKIIPLMTAMNIKNRKYMENQGKDLSTKLIGKPGVGADELEGGVGRWTPYMYRGKLSNPVSIANEEIAGSDLYGQELTDKRNSIIRDKASLFDKGSYASNVFENIDKNLERTLPGEYFYLPQEMQPIKITAKKKKKNGGWLEKYK